MGISKADFSGEKSAIHNCRWNRGNVGTMWWMVCRGRFCLPRSKTVVMEATDVLFSKRPTDSEKPAHCESEGQVFVGLADVCGGRNGHLAHGQTFRVRN